MKLIKCRKCGTPLASNDLMIQRLLDGMEEANKNAMKSKNASQRYIYIQQASQYKQLIKSITHATTQLEERRTYERAELKELVKYLMKNNIMTCEEISLIQDSARKNVEIAIKEERQKISKLYQDGYNELYNNSKSYTTHKKAMKSIR